MRQRSCDQHPRYQGGCVPCNARSMRYVKRRGMLAQRGVRLSVAADLTAQRLQSLRAYGYPISALAEATTTVPSQIVRLCNGRTRWVQLGTYQAVERAYRELSVFPGPDRRAAAAAARRGWTPPPPPPAPEPDDSAVDWVVIERLAEGMHVPGASRAEKVAAWDLLGDRGMTKEDRQRIMHTGTHSIETWRTRDPRTWRRQTA